MTAMMSSLENAKGPATRHAATNFAILHHLRGRGGRDQSHAMKSLTDEHLTPYSNIHVIVVPTMRITVSGRSEGPET